MEASPSDPSVSSIVLQSPERFFDRRLFVRVHIAGNKKVQLSALCLQVVPRSADLLSLYQWKKNPSRRVWFSYAHETLPDCSSLHGSVRLEVFWNPLSGRRVGEFGRILESENQVLLSEESDNYYRELLLSL